MYYICIKKKKQQQLNIKVMRTMTSEKRAAIVMGITFVAIAITLICTLYSNTVISYEVINADGETSYTFTALRKFDVKQTENVVTFDGYTRYILEAGQTLQVIK